MKDLAYSIKYCFILFILVNVSGLALAQQSPSPLLVEARNDLPKAFENEKDCIGLCNKLNQAKNPEPILKGYVGAVNIARARHAPLFDKMTFLKTGTGILEEAIREKPNSTELLFLRLTIQINLPSFLGYNDNIDEDKKFVLANYGSAPAHLKIRISNFIKDSDSFTAEEKARTK